MRERLRNWSPSVCTACSVCICAVFIAWRGNVFMRRKKNDRIVVQAVWDHVRGIASPGHSPSMHRVWKRLLQQLIMSVTHWLFASSFRNCWGIFQSQGMRRSTTPTHIYICTLIYKVFLQKAAPSWEVQPGCRTEFQHRDQEWKHALAPDQLPGSESRVKAKELTLFSFVERTHFTSAGSKAEDEKIKHTFIICRSLCVSACFRFFFLVFLSFCKRQSVLLCQFACSLGVLFLFLIKQFVKAELLKLYSQT